LLPRRCCGPCPPPRRPRRRRLSSKRPSNRLKVRRLASASKEVRETTGARKAPSPRRKRAAQRSVPPTRGACRPRSGSSTRASKPKTATPATSSTPGGRATWRHAQRWATTLDGVGAMTAGRTAHRRRSHREPVCSTGRSARRASPALLPAHDDRQVQWGDGPPCVAQRLLPGVSARRGYHRRGYHP
jgi:hypothetical protein